MRNGQNIFIGTERKICEICNFHIERKNFRACARNCGIRTFSLYIVKLTNMICILISKRHTHRPNRLRFQKKFKNTRNVRCSFVVRIETAILNIF